MERLDKLEAMTVRGNHDRRVALDSPQEMGSSDSFAHARLTQTQLDWLGGLPFQREIVPSVLAFHARPDHDERYLTEGLADGRLVRGPMASIVRRLEGLDAAYRLLLYGHS